MPNSKNAVSTTSGSIDASPNNKKSKSAVFILLTILSVAIIIAAIILGTFYFIVKNNTGGFADRYRQNIQSIPIIRNALPAVEDPLDPKYLTSKELKEKYNEFRAENESLKKELEDARKELEVYDALKDEFENGKIEAENKLKKAEERNSDLDVKEAELKELKSQIDKLIASGNKEAFAAYYESIDAENAEKLYSQVIKERQVDAKTKEFAQIYAEMDESAAAAIFEQLGDEKLDMISETFMAMSKKDSSAIIESMTPSFAAKVTEKLNELYKGN